MTEQVWTRFIGVDFSGAESAGRKIWVTEAEVTARGLRVSSLERSDRKFGVSSRREDVLPALVKFIAGQRGAFIGMDFPFSLPSRLLGGTSWHDFVLQLGERFANQDEFREWCWTQAGNQELRRETERAAATPFCAYNRWIKFQTFYGISQVIAPLIRAGAASVPPMERLRPGVATVVEICPASTLKSLRLDGKKYKGRGTDCMEKRRTILASLRKSGLLAEIPGPIEQQALADHEGDALDAIIAAVAASQAAAQLTSGETPWAGNKDEGWVFV